MYGTVYRKGGHAVGTAGYQGAYGILFLPELWWPRQSKLDTCEKVATFYTKYSKYRAKYKRLSVSDRAAKEGRSLVDSMQQAERNGKAAWKNCKGDLEAQGKGAEADRIDQEQEQQDGGYLSPDAADSDSTAAQANWLLIGGVSLAALGTAAYFLLR